LIEDDGLKYSCYVKAGQDYQKIKRNEDVPGFFDPDIYPAVT
jgi:hypothetical protein